MSDILAPIDFEQESNTSWIPHIQVTTGEKAYSLTDTLPGHIFEWLYEYVRSDAIQISKTHPVLQWHFNAGQELVPGVILKSIFLALMKYNIKQITTPKITFLNMCFPGDILHYDQARKTLIAERKQWPVEIARIEDSMIALYIPHHFQDEEPNFQHTTLSEESLEKHLPQKPPFRFINGYIDRESSSDNKKPWADFTTIWYVDSYLDVSRETVEEAAAQAISYHLSSKNNPDGYKKGAILTYESSHVITYQHAIEELRSGDAVTTYGYLHADYIEYQVVNHRRHAILAEGIITGKKIKWKLFERIYNITKNTTN